MSRGHRDEMVVAAGNVFAAIKEVDEGNVVAAGAAGGRGGGRGRRGRGGCHRGGYSNYQIF